MKNLKLFALLILASSLVLISCKDDEPDIIDRDATFTQMDQVARPSINTVFTTTGNKNQFNTTVTANLQSQFGSAYVDRINALNPGYTTNLLGLDAQTFGNFLAADVLTVARTGETNFFEGLGADDSNLSGRRLSEDVIDVELLLLFGGPDGSENPGLTSDGVDSNDRQFSGTFPYLASPFGQ
jgi:hypothetical protein